jgi:Trypsin-co-occurring domain 1
MPDAALLRVPVGDGSDEFVEIQVSRTELQDLSESGVVLASDDGSRFEAVTFSLASAMDRVIPALRVILGRLRAGVHSPDEITMELGLQVGGEAGVFFAKGTAEATVAVTMTWRRGPAAEGEGGSPDDGQQPS